MTVATLTEIPHLIFFSLLTAFLLHFPKLAQWQRVVSPHALLHLHPACGRAVPLRALPIPVHKHRLSLPRTSTPQCVPQTRAGLGLIHLIQAQKQEETNKSASCFSKYL